MPARSLLLCLLPLLPCSAQPPRAPDLAAQRTAMQKLSFLAGSWTGEAHIYRNPGEPVVLTQTEDAQFKLNGLLLEIEGVGRAQGDGPPALQALGIISYDDQTSAYHMRAFNDGRYLETEVKLLDTGKGITWGFTLGTIQIHAVLRISAAGDWTEMHEITIGAQPARKYMEVRVSPRK